MPLSLCPSQQNVLQRSSGSSRCKEEFMPFVFPFQNVGRVSSRLISSHRPANLHMLQNEDHGHCFHAGVTYTNITD